VPRQEGGPVGEPDPRSREENTGAFMYAAPVRFTAQIGLVVVAGVFLGRSAAARRRPLFEPTDLEMEDPGMLEVDLQFGVLRGQAPWRFAVPDFEVDLGLGRGIEVDIDGAYAIEGPDDGGFSFERPAPDNLWTTVKLGLYDEVDEDTKVGWAIGAQLGPKVPVGHDAHGLGYEALILVGRHSRSDNHLVFNLGGFVDPGATTISSQRTTGIEGGVDWSVALPSTSLSVTGELAGVRFFSSDPYQMHATAGFTWSSTSAFDLSLIGLVALFGGGDRAGVLLGVSPKIALWR